MKTIEVRTNNPTRLHELINKYLRGDVLDIMTVSVDDNGVYRVAIAINPGTDTQEFLKAVNNSLSVAFIGLK